MMLRGLIAVPVVLFAAIVVFIMVPAIAIVLLAVPTVVVTMVIVILAMLAQHRRLVFHLRVLGHLAVPVLVTHGLAHILGERRADANEVLSKVLDLDVELHEAHLVEEDIELNVVFSVPDKNLKEAREESLVQDLFNRDVQVGRVKAILVNHVLYNVS